MLYEAPTRTVLHTTAHTHTLRGRIKLICVHLNLLRADTLSEWAQGSLAIAYLLRAHINIYMCPYVYAALGKMRPFFAVPQAPQQCGHC